MVRKAFVISVVLLFAAIAFAAGSDTIKLKGYVIDNACSTRAKSENGVEKVKAHSIKCAQMPNCAKSGYAVVTEEGKLYKLDDAGNAKVADILKATKVDKGLQVDVEGTVDGDTVKIKTISEVVGN
jgi:type 1 fimbria pilin